MEKAPKKYPSLKEVAPVTLDSTNTNALFLLQGVVPGYVCDFQEEVAL